MIIIQWLIVLFSVFALTRVVLRYLDRRINFKDLVLWVVLWVSVIVFVLLPQTSSLLARVFGVGRGVDLLIYVSIVVLFYLVFKLFVKLEKIEEDITRLTKELALKELRKKKR